MLYLVTRDLSTRALAGGMVCGYAIGLMPSTTPQYALLISLPFLFRINLPLALTTALAVFGLSDFCQGGFHSLGLWFLTDLPWLHPIFHLLFQWPLLTFFQLNHTLVLGATLFLIVTAPPVYFLAKLAFSLSREHLRLIIVRSYLWRVLTTQHHERRVT